MQNIELKVISIIKEFLGNKEDVDMSKSLDDLGIDSVDGVQIVTRIEEEFGISISIDDANKILQMPVKEVISKIYNKEYES